MCVCVGRGKKGGGPNDVWKKGGTEGRMEKKRRVVYYLTFHGFSLLHCTLGFGGGIIDIIDTMAAMDFEKDTFQRCALQCSIESTMVYSHIDVHEGGFAIHGWRVFIELPADHPHINENVEFLNDVYKFCGTIDYVAGAMIGFVSIHEKIGSLKIVKDLCEQLWENDPRLNCHSAFGRTLKQLLQKMKRRPGRYGNPDLTPCIVSASSSDGSKMCTNCSNMVHPTDTICGECGERYHMWKRPVSTKYWDEDGMKYVP